MKQNAMGKNLTQSIRKSLGRYLAIVFIIALGASMFVGLLMTKSDMVATGQRYMDEQNMFDLRLLNSYGWTKEHVDAAKELPGLVDIEGVMYTDIIVRLNDSTDDLVYRFYRMPQTVNQVDLRGGRWPESPDECLADGYHADDSILGTKITISPTNEEGAADGIRYQTYTVVGYVANPLYMDMNRGTTSVGSGSLSNYILIPEAGMELDYYAEINATIPGKFEVYSSKYNDALDAAGDALKPLLQPLADDRLVEVKREALQAYGEGKREYEEGLAQFQEEKEKAEAELAQGLQKLLDAEQKIADNEKLLQDGEQQIAAAWQQIYDGERQLNEGRQQLDSIKALLLNPIASAEKALREKYDPAVARIGELDVQIAAIEAEIAEIQAEISEDAALIAELEEKIEQTQRQINSLNAQIRAAQGMVDLLMLMPELNAEAIAQLKANIANMTAQVAALEAQLPELEAQLAEASAKVEAPLAKMEELEAQLEPLEAERSSTQLSVDRMQPTLDQLTAARENVEQMFASSEAELEAAQEQLAQGRGQLAYQQSVLEKGKQALEEGKLELADGWKEYEDGKAEFDQEISKAEAELADAESQLEEAWEIIQNMTQNEVMILDRSSNIGYNSLDSASDIVQGVSRVFPAFFLLVAALVCITTMTRMIDEERTQIGTLKALGYSNGAIIRKYMIYAGSGAILGCGLGVLVGSAAFPVILWQAYKIMLYITDGIVLQINWGLCGVVVGAYTAVMLLVTWYCCRRCLSEEPAELIRPKAPDPGKKILLEYLPFWKKISFLNKVTIRNIFRYRQRLAMMLVGIGGCTALLVTGFGLRDSIVNVVDYQFQEVTIYDLSVYFSDGQTGEEQADFIKDTAEEAESVMFYHQSSVEMDFDDATKEIYLIAAGEGVTDFIDLHSDETLVEVPGLNEVVLSIGAAEAMGIDIGDTVTMRNADLKILTLTVSGIYDNHVYNYAIIAPETVQEQWGALPAMQMAFVKVKEGQDIHLLSAEITGMSDVMNVSVSEDLADMVSNMMEALDLVVWVIVFCAGALAVIVLYNLTNININERIREIATIKVLGFNATETAMYVFKENLTLTAFGSLFGLALGYLLLLFVMSQIRIDMVFFKALVFPKSYVISVVLTILSAIIVDFIFYFKLDKINMAEALKSVE